ncbi:hypothetical protein CUJ84_Chr001606 [Rhizobium leguminosarum]|uniref:Uncharacterized protein n=1 Tax=Rhizobium leguminosarum TaxID=384 RepID=A0A2K9Z1L8_RHILE|nr:hypothetical protein CUJ84_Chr001606 [Rhizobium leguminosarum]
MKAGSFHGPDLSLIDPGLWSQTHVNARRRRYFKIERPHTRAYSATRLFRRVKDAVTL